MKHKVLLLGAGDRFNYGDLLFPHILVNAIPLVDSVGLVFNNYGLVKSNLSTYGAYPTHSIKAFYKDLALASENITIIIIGGEVLGPHWNNLLKCISSLYYSFSLKKRVKRYINLEKIAKTILGGRSERPYILEGRILKESCKLIYNSVGGISLPFDDHYEIKRVISNLSEARYLAVRDIYTYDGLRKNGLENCVLVPDSAILMHEFFDMVFLKEKITSQLNEKIAQIGQGYVFFQTNKKYGEKYFDSIIKFLTTIVEQYKFKVILCPIGKAPNHEDDKILRLISGQLHIQHYYYENPNIWEIMYLIANSNLFIGTSLHGIITAMSFLVPYVGLFKENKKIDLYLKTWGLPPTNHSYSIENLEKELTELSMITKKDLKKNREVQIIRVKESMAKIKEAIYS